MRRLCIALLILVLAPAATAQDAEFARLMQDGDRAKAIGEAVKILKKYFKLAQEVDRGRFKNISKRDRAMTDFLAWLDESEKLVGIDLRTRPYVVVEIFDRARVDTLATKVARGKIDYVKVPDARGLERLEYAVHLPSKYNYKSKDNHRYPLVVSLHERVINVKHPAFRSKPLQERSRAAIYNGWYKTPGAEKAVIVAPTGNPNGFQFTKDPVADLQLLYRIMGKGLTDFRTEWTRVFLEVHGPALRVACQQSLMFAGVILRDREGSRKPPIAPEEYFMFENLNGVPLLYIADEAVWNKIGKPLSDALAAAYKKVGKPENFVLVKDRRDGNGALKGDPALIADFITKHRRPAARKSFAWRYSSAEMAHPVPISITQANYLYDELASLEQAAGALKFEVELEKYKDKQGKERHFNLIDIQVTEAEALSVLLHDGIVNMSLPISVRVNGKLIHDKVTVKRDWNDFVSDALPLRFFMLPFVAELKCTFEPKPQFVRPAKQGAAKQPAKGEEGAQGAEKTAGEDRK